MAGPAGRPGDVHLTITGAVAADMRAKPAGASQRYGLTHFHPGQIRNTYRKHNQADLLRALDHDDY
jgi:hypothetical protein